MPVTPYYYVFGNPSLTHQSEHPDRRPKTKTTALPSRTSRRRRGLDLERRDGLRRPDRLPQGPARRGRRRRPTPSAQSGQLLLALPPPPGQPVRHRRHGREGRRRLLPVHLHRSPQGRGYTVDSTTLGTFDAVSTTMAAGTADSPEDRVHLLAPADAAVPRRPRGPAARTPTGGYTPGVVPLRRSSPPTATASKPFPRRQRGRLYLRTETSVKNSKATNPLKVTGKILHTIDRPNGRQSTLASTYDAVTTPTDDSEGLLPVQRP